MRGLTLRGDLHQMGVQNLFLRQRGYDLTRAGVYSIIKPVDVKSALTAIYIQRCEGWWHYKEEYIEHDICSDEQFTESFI